MLEETHFRNRTKAFIGLLIYAMIVLLALSPLTSIPFLGSPLSFSLVYIYSRLNPEVRMSFLGLFIFRAPYLPWVLLGFSLLLNNQIPVGDLMGIAVGHGYYFYEICRRDGDGDFWRGVRGLRRQMGNRLATWTRLHSEEWDWEFCTSLRLRLAWPFLTFLQKRKDPGETWLYPYFPITRDTSK